MQFLLHIGVNKTGTSSLQRAFDARRGALAAAGILYPETGIHLAGHHGISRLIKGATPASQKMPDDWEDRLRGEFGDHNLCVLSSEDFATVTDVAPLARICPPGQTRVVVYLRDYARHLASWYQQAMQSRNISMSLDNFIEVHRASFSDIIARWSQVYGRENVSVRLYDRTALKDNDIVADFCDFLPPGMADVFAGMEHASNPSLSGNLLFFKRMMNCFITREESVAVTSEFTGLATLDPSFRGALAVDEDTVRRIRFLTRTDCTRVEAATGLDLNPRHRRIAGAKSPDLDRLEADVDKIVQAAKARNFQMLAYIARMQTLRPLLAIDL